MPRNILLMLHFPILSPGSFEGLPVTPSGGFGIGIDQLTTMTRDHNFSALQQYGGVSDTSMLIGLMLLYIIVSCTSLCNFCHYVRLKG